VAAFEASSALAAQSVSGLVRWPRQCSEYCAGQLLNLAQVTKSHPRAPHMEMELPAAQASRVGGEPGIPDRSK
jgi:hypothetical protein